VRKLLLIKDSSFFFNVRGLTNQKIVEMLFNLLKLHKPLLVFLDEPMMSYTDVLDVLFKYVNLHLVVSRPVLGHRPRD